MAAMKTKKIRMREFFPDSRETGSDPPTPAH